MLVFLLGESDVAGPGQRTCSRCQPRPNWRAKNAVRAALLQRRGMAAMARRRGLLVSVHADARCGPGGRKHHLRMLFPTFAKESYSIGCGENSARPNALSRAWKMRVTAPEHDADRTERLVEYVRRCPHRDGV